MSDVNNILLQVQKAHKRSDQSSNEDDDSGDTFDSLNNSIANNKDTGVKKKFRVNGHRVHFLQNIQHQVCFRDRISLHVYYLLFTQETLLHVTSNDFE